IAKKYNTTVSSIKSLNNLKSDLIFVNQKLVVAGKTQSSSSSSNTKITEETSSQSGEYKVKSGDTLSGLAKKYDTSVSQLKEWNQLKSDMIYVGQVLIVNAESGKENSDKGSYLVVSGDTLSGIALKFNLTVQQLKDKNQLSSDLIYIDQILSI
ncbi:LysM repeat-containing protein, partial [Marinilactibacillus piezotolerans]